LFELNTKAIRMFKLTSTTAILNQKSKQLKSMNACNALILKNPISLSIAKGIVISSLLLLMTAAVSAPLLLQETAAQITSLKPMGAIPNATTSTPTSSPDATTNGTIVTRDAGPLKVNVILFGIDNKSSSIVTFVTVKNITKALGGNSLQLDVSDNKTDGIAEVFFTFPEITPNVGDKFEACSVVVEDRSLTCTEGFKSPTNRTETAQLLVTDKTLSLK
jgi:hypothetical protein